jgi:CheY-like chemotaxis protein
VVDDHADFRDAVRLLLERAGYRVITAENGAQALTIAAQQCPDVILMDISMPVLDGVAATAQLKASASLADIPVIGLTAQAFDGVEERARAAGMLEILPKQAFAELVSVLGTLMQF